MTERWVEKALKQNVSSKYEVYLSDSLHHVGLWGHQQPPPYSVSFHSPVNLDLLIVGGTIKTQQLFNQKRKKNVLENSVEQREAV